jgi:hypothetical protein
MGEKSRFYVKFASMKSSLFLVVACGLGSAVNASFTLVFLRFVGQVRYSAAAPLLTVGSVAATAAIGVEYVATIHIVRSGSLTVARRQVFLVLIFGSPLLILAPVVAAFLHIGSSVPVLLATALFVCTFAAAFPSAMLLGYGRLWALGLISILEPGSASRCLCALRPPRANRRRDVDFHRGHRCRRNSHGRDCDCAGSASAPINTCANSNYEKTLDGQKRHWSWIAASLRYSHVDG